MPITVIATNNTSNTISIDDLGISINSSESITLTDYFEYIELTESNDLYNSVQSGDIGINDGTSDLNIQQALQHLSFESEYQDIIQDSSIVGTVAMDLACVDISNTNQFSVNSSWTDTVFPNTDLENDPNTIQHDTIQQSRILIKEDGIYNISAIYTARNNTNWIGKCYYRVIKNSSYVISQERYQNLYKSEIHCFAENITRHLSQGDYVTCQVKTDSGTSVDIITCSFKITKQEGVQGEQGLPGGTTVDIKKDGNIISSNVDSINFEGNVSAVDDGNSQCTVTILSPDSAFRYINVYDSTGHVNINSNTAFSFDWNSQYIRDTDTFDHSTITNPSRIYFNKDGLFKISYNVLYENQSNTRKNIKCYIRLNSNDVVNRTSTASYVRSYTDKYGSNSLAPVLCYFNSGDYIELMYHREGSSGSVSTIPNECWLQVEFVR